MQCGGWDGAAGGDQLLALAAEHRPRFELYVAGGAVVAAFTAAGGELGAFGVGEQQAAGVICAFHLDELGGPQPGLWPRPGALGCPVLKPVGYGLNLLWRNRSSTARKARGV